MSNPKSAPKSNIFGAIFMAIVVSFMGAGLFLWYNHNEKLATQATSIKDCEVNGYNRLLNDGLITEKTPRLTVINNCETLEARVHTILDRYDAPWFPVYITGHLTSDCGESSVGCVTSRHYGISNYIPAAVPPVMTISYSADYYQTLEHTVTHEYIHTLTDGPEMDYLTAHPEAWPKGVTPVEGVADCGVTLLTKKPFEPGSYMKTCSTEQTNIAKAVIENTLIENEK